MTYYYRCVVIMYPNVYENTCLEQQLQHYDLVVQLYSCVLLSFVLCVKETIMFHE